MTRVGVIQPCYLPWKGYFDLIHEVDAFVFLDDVQYSKFNWRNRNRIKTRQGELQWLTVPVLGGHDQLIVDVRIHDRLPWRRKHLAAIRQNYGRTPHFDAFFPALEEAIESTGDSLAELDIALAKLVAARLGIEVRWLRSSEMDLPDGADRNVRLLEIVKAAGGTEYRSGLAARGYLSEELFDDAGIEVVWHSYDGYPEYAQISDPFEHQVSVVDLLFMTGPEAPDHIWGARRSRA